MPPHGDQPEGTLLTATWEEPCRRALVEESPQEACRADALRAEAFDTFAVDDGDALSETARRPALACYLQLAPPPRGAQVASTRWPAGRELVARVDRVASVAERLAPNATVILVADGRADPRSGGWRLADVLGRLTEAALADQGYDRIPVMVIAPSSPAAFAGIARQAVAGSLPPPSLADLAPDLGHADWRDEILGLTSTPDATFFGWISSDGDARLAVLRGSVLSPLPSPLEGNPPPWGWPTPGAHALARTLIAAALGHEGRCPASPPEAGWPTCRGRDLVLGSPRLVEAFVKEVVHSLPGPGFEPPASHVADWVHRRRGPLPTHAPRTGASVLIDPPLRLPATAHERRLRFPPAPPCLVPAAPDGSAATACSAATMEWPSGVDPHVEDVRHRPGGGRVAPGDLALGRRPLRRPRPLHCAEGRGHLTLLSAHDRRSFLDSRAAPKAEGRDRFGRQGSSLGRNVSAGPLRGAVPNERRSTGSEGRRSRSSSPSGCSGHRYRFERNHGDDPDSAAVVLRPFEVLGSAEERRGPGRQFGEPATQLSAGDTREARLRWAGARLKGPVEIRSCPE